VISSQASARKRYSAERVSMVVDFWSKQREKCPGRQHW